ncbi:MAG: apolipoprotein N-acyltransferase, partial [Nitratireductor sp.]
NSGISAVIDSSGRILDAFDLNAVGNLDVRLPVHNARKFYFGNPGTNGTFIAFGFGAVLFGSSIIRRLRAN